jgi:hypothetical protein
MLYAYLYLLTLHKIRKIMLISKSFLLLFIFACAPEESDKIYENICVTVGMLAVLFISYCGIFLIKRSWLDHVGFFDVPMYNNNTMKYKKFPITFSFLNFQKMSLQSAGQVTFSTQCKDFAYRCLIVIKTLFSYLPPY